MLLQVISVYYAEYQSWKATIAWIQHRTFAPASRRMLPAGRTRNQSMLTKVYSVNYVYKLSTASWLITTSITQHYAKHCSVRTSAAAIRKAMYCLRLRPIGHLCNLCTVTHWLRLYPSITLKLVNELHDCHTPLSINNILLHQHQ